MSLNRFKNSRQSVYFQKISKIKKKKNKSVWIFLNANAWYLSLYGAHQVYIYRRRSSAIQATFSAALFFSRLFSLPFLFGPNEIDKNPTTAAAATEMVCSLFFFSLWPPSFTCVIRLYNSRQFTASLLAWWLGGFSPFALITFLYAPKKGSCGFDSVQSNDLKERRPCIPPFLVAHSY